MTENRLIRTLPADLLTPVGAYLLVREALGAPAFLLESMNRADVPKSVMPARSAKSNSLL